MPTKERNVTSQKGPAAVYPYIEISGSELQRFTSERETFGAALSCVIRAALLDRTALAHLLGIGPRTLASWEKGATKPTQVNLEKLVSVLRTRLDELDDAGKLHNRDIVLRYSEKHRVLVNEIPIGLLGSLWLREASETVTSAALDAYFWDGLELQLRDDCRPDRVSLLMPGDLNERGAKDELRAYHVVTFLRRSSLQAERYAIVTYDGKLRLAQQQGFFPASKPRLLRLCAIGESSMVLRSNAFEYPSEEVEITAVAIEYVAPPACDYSDPSTRTPAQVRRRARNSRDLQTRRDARSRQRKARAKRKTAGPK